MTVKECIEFAAKLRFLGTPEERDKKVTNIIRDLKLTKCQDTKIGGVFIKGISGGERKRTSIGVELITDPSLIFLDEPTTGLDSFTSTQIMMLLKNLAESGRTIIQTIHQPNSDIFDMFDQLMLMAHGQIIYFNESDKARDYFDKIGYTVPLLANPADFYMSMMSIESIEDELEDEGVDPQTIGELAANQYAKRIKLFTETYANSELRNDPNTIMKNHKFEPVAKQSSSNRVSWCTEFVMLARRNTLNQVRLPKIQFFKFISVIANSIICIIIYAGTFEGTREGVQNRNGALFFTNLGLGFQGLNNVAMLLPAERPVFMREVNNGMYRVSSYFWSKVLSELTISILTPLVSMIIVFFSLGFNNSDSTRLLAYLLVAVLTYNSFSGFGFLLGAAIATKEVLNIMLPVIVVPTMLFSGFFVNQDNVPYFLKPFEYISIYKYSYQAFIQTEYQGLELECMSDKTPPQLRCSPEEDFKAQQSFSTCIWVMLGIYIICLLLANFCLWKKSRQVE